MLPDVEVHFAYSPKDAKWRWLLEVPDADFCKAGEESTLTKAFDAVEEQATNMITDVIVRHK